MRSLPPLATKDRVFGAVLVVTCGIIQAIALAVAAFATRDAFAALHLGTELSVRTIIELALSGGVAALCLLLSRTQAEALGQSYAIALRHVLYKQIASLPKSSHEQRRVGALSLRFVGDLSAARLWFGRGLPDVLTAIAVLPGAVVILASLDPALAGLGLAPLGLALLCMIGTAWHLERRHRQLRRQRANVAIAMVERIAIAPDLDLMGRTEKELRALDARGASLRKDAVARRGRSAGLQAILQVGVALSGLMILWLASESDIAPATVAASLSVLALVALPLQDLGASWDRYCAWRVARGKVQRLLGEPYQQRRSKRANAPVGLYLKAQVGGKTTQFAAKAGEVARLEGSRAPALARIIAGLDCRDDVDLRFDGASDMPRLSYIGDVHIGLQGSLRRSTTLSARKRPTDATICHVLETMGLGDLLRDPEGLDQRLAENGKGLSAAQTLRLDLVRAILGQADVIVVSSLRWSADPDKDRLMENLRQHSPATIILADNASDYTPLEKSEVS